MKRDYEAMVIIHHDVTEEEIKEFTDKLESLIQQKKGEIIKVEKWGKRKLAYRIKKSYKGYYLIVCFNGEKDCLDEMERSLRYNDKVLRYQTVIMTS